MELDEKSYISTGLLFMSVYNLDFFSTKACDPQ